MIAAIVSAYLLGVAIGIFVRGIAQRSIIEQPWLICKNCKYNKDISEKDAIRI